jgi:DNA invertase Pin-like site-specific DNA recombinase
MTIYGYARVSTVQQDLKLQTDALERAGVPPLNIRSEKQSGKSTKNRPVWNLLKEELVAGDVVYVHKLDRLGRSMVDVMSIVEFFKENGIYLVVLDAGIDTRKDEEDGMAGLMTKALMTILALMAEMERTFIAERTRPAIEQAKANGVPFGRKEKNKEIYEIAVNEYALSNGKLSINDIVKKYGSSISKATFCRRLKEYGDYSEAIEKFNQGMDLDQVIADGGTDKDGKLILNEKKFNKLLIQYQRKEGYFAE